MRFHVVTLFPEIIDTYAGASILGRAQREGKLEVTSHQLRDFVANPAKAGAHGARKWFYRKVDDKPYGGGPGMVLQAEPFLRGVENIVKRCARTNVGTKPKILITSAGGTPLTNTMAKKLAKEKDVIILCGRYEGIDARAKRILKAQEVSTGPYILTGGEVPALAIIDATARQIPGVLGKSESLEESRVASHDVYTRPEVLEWRDAKGAMKRFRVPKVLLSGHHAHIDAHRSKKRSHPEQR